MSVKDLKKLLEEREKFPAGQESSVNDSEHKVQDKEVSTGIQGIQRSRAVLPSGSIRFPKWYVKRKGGGKR